MINREQAIQESYEHGNKDVVKTVAAWKEYLRNLPEPTGTDCMSLVTRKPVFGVSDQGRLKPACSATEAS